MRRAETWTKKRRERLLRFFIIPVRCDTGLQEDLNVFLRSHRVLTVHREFVAQGDNSFWALAVEFLEGMAQSGSGPGNGRGGKQRVDYKEILSPEDFALFAKLRDWRKATAEQDGIPVYAVLTNEQLAAIATKRPETASQLREIEGVGEAKAEKYADGVLAVLASAGGTTSVATAANADTVGDPVPPGDAADETHR